MSDGVAILPSYLVSPKPPSAMLVPPRTMMNKDSLVKLNIEIGGGGGGLRCGGGGGR